MFSFCKITDEQNHYDNEESKAKDKKEGGNQ